jgi:MFS family permease
MDQSAIQRTDWLAIFVIFLSGLVAAMQFAKVAPIMNTIGAELGLDAVGAGLAVSIIGLVGILFAITVGAIVSAIGTGRGILIALFGGGLIAIAGGWSPGAFTFLASRFCEGFSHLLIVVCAPALMSAHAAQKDKPVALSIWGCFFGLGFAIASAAAPLIVPYAGWRGFMMSHGAAMLIIGVMAKLVLARSGHIDQRTALPSLRAIVNTHVEVFRSGGPLLLSLTFCAYTILFLAALTFLTLYLATEASWAPESVGAFMSVASFVTLIFTLVAGFLVKAGVTLFQSFAAAFAGLAITSIAVFVFHPGTVMLVALIMVMMAC